MAVVIGHGGIGGLVSACPLAGLLDWSQFIQRLTLGGHLGLGNFSIAAAALQCYGQTLFCESLHSNEPQQHYAESD